MSLPAELREVSAIVAVDATTIACLQDETGALFFVDLEGKRAPRSRVFGPAGDYEGLALVGDRFWVLRADGVLLQLRDHHERYEVQSTVQLPGGFGEWESLCYDADRRLLLAAPKGESAVAKGENGEAAARSRQRPVFGIDPVTAAVQAEPVLVLDAVVLETAVAAIDVQLSGRGKPKHERGKLHFVWSELLAVPGSGDLLVLLVRDHALLRVGRDGKLLGIGLLDPEQLQQPEGLALLRDGRLLVASEAEGRGEVRVVPMP